MSTEQKPAAPVAQCAQCKKEYRHGSGVGCPKCAPGVSVPESEFRKPITAPAAPVAPRAPLTPEKIKDALATITHEVPVRLPPGWEKFARAIERAHGIG